MTAEFRITDGWTAIDQWWKETPLRRHFVVVELTREGEPPKRACVRYDEVEDTWTITPEEDEQG